MAEGTPDDLKSRVGEPTVHVELADPASAGRAREALAELGRLEPPNERAPCRVALRAAAGTGAIAPVVRALDEHDVVVESVELEEPSLDDVFVAVTGSHLEGATAPDAEVEAAAIEAPG
jgi:ABC-2 type transport system ATP-binding protein